MKRTRFRKPAISFVLTSVISRVLCFLLEELCINIGYFRYSQNQQKTSESLHSKLLSFHGFWKKKSLCPWTKKFFWSLVFELKLQSEPSPNSFWAHTANPFLSLFFTADFCRSFQKTTFLSVVMTEISLKQKNVVCKSSAKKNKKQRKKVLLCSSM